MENLVIDPLDTSDHVINFIGLPVSLTILGTKPKDFTVMSTILVKKKRPSRDISPSFSLPDH